MLKIEVPSREFFDEATNTFVVFNGQTLQLEHSLISISKWEAKWHKPFLTNKEKTTSEIIDYVRCMTVTPSVDDKTYASLTDQNLKDILAYIDDPMTATTVHNRASNRVNDEIMTSEVIYCYMIQLGIPFECQKWHLSRLIKLIEVCSIKNSPGKKMSTNEILRQNRSLNDIRRAAMHTKG